MEQFNDAEKTIISTANPEATQIVSQPQAGVTQKAVTLECPVCHTPNASTETYCSDCGFLLSSSPVEVEVPELEGPSARLITPDGREFTLNPGINTVGRVDADVLTNDPTVSRKHAEIVFNDNAWWVTDSGSTNGTFIDNAQIPANEPTQLVNGAVIKFGAVAMTFESTEAGPAVAETTVVVGEAEAAEEVEVEEAEEAVEVEAAPADAVQEFEVEPVEAGPETVEPEVVEPETPAIVGKLVNLTDPFANYSLIIGVNTIGRAPGNSVQISGDPYVSGRHAQIAYEDDKFILIDVGSTNGTLLNGQPIPKNEPQELKSGDEIGIGQGRYRLEA